MKIPESIQLLGKTIPTVPLSDANQADNVLGMADYISRTIELASMCRGRIVSEEEKEQTYFHELLHHCLNTMGKDKLNRDEQFVDLLGGLLHQALAPHMK